MATIKWHVSTNRVGSKMTGEFELTDDLYTEREDGTRVLDEAAIDEVVFEKVCQSISHGWEIVEDAAASGKAR